MRQQAVIELSQLYKNTGEHEKALLLAQSAPDINATRLMLRINAFDGKEEVAASGEALLDMIMRSTELIESIVRTDIHMQPNTAAEMIKNATMMFDLVYTDHFYGKSSAWLACLNMLRSYYLWLAGEKDSAFEALDLALSHATAYDKLRETSPEFFASPLLRHVKTNAGSMSAQSGFKEELPEVWPWWCVSKCKIVKEEMQTDSRWDEWVRKTKA